MDTINTSIDTYSVDKKKKSFLPKLLIALSSLFSIVGVGLAILPNHYKSARAVSYDDENNSITLSADELNNYTFSHLNAYIISYYLEDEDYGFMGDISLIYNNNYFTFEYFENVGGYAYFYYSYSDTPIAFNLDRDNRFTIDDNSDFQYSLVFDLQNMDYDTWKSVVEQDIAANQPYEPINLLQDMITLIFGGVVGVATGVGGGLSDLTNALVMQSGVMSPFIAIVFIFGGLALAFGLSRWVVNLVGSLGQRNR